MKVILNMLAKVPPAIVAAIGLKEYQECCGLFTSPKSAGKGINPIFASAYNVPWCADNDCFTEYNPERIKQFLARYQGHRNCKFFNAPDVLLDAKATTERFEEWYPIIKGYGFPIAYTVQNGCTREIVPWAKADALFIGANNEFRTYENLKPIIDEAKKRHMWVHIGRIHSEKGIRFAQMLGCDSFDSTGYVRFGTAKLKKHLPLQRWYTRALAFGAGA